MKKLILFALLASLILTEGCTALNNMTESMKNKNIAAGSDTWGGDVIFEFAGTESLFPNINIWFGRRRVWYVSLKEGNAKDIAEIVKSSNSALEVSVGASGVNFKQAYPDSDDLTDSSKQ